MRVIAKKTLKEYFEKNAESKQPLLIWFKEVSNGKPNMTRLMQQKYKRHELEDYKNEETIQPSA